MNEQQNTREAKREDDVVWGMYVDLDKPELLDKIWDRGFAAGAASVDRRAVDVILFCPECKTQHIDKAEPDNCELCGKLRNQHTEIGKVRRCEDGQEFTAWLNPPHKKHRCHECNHVWKAANIPTNGVAVLAEMEVKDEH